METSPLVAHKFDDSNTLLASVVLSLDTHQVRVVSIDSKSEFDVNTSLNLDKDNRVSSLNWIRFQEDDQIVVIGCSNGTILFYSPLTNTILNKITTASNNLVTDVIYSSHTNSIWGSDIGGNVYEWDLGFSLTSQFSAPELLENVDSVHNILTISYNDEPHLLLGSNSIYLVNIASKQLIHTFPAHVNSITSLVPVPYNSDYFLSTANNDRFINLYSLSKRSIKQVFVAQTSVLDISVGAVEDKTVLVARTETGILECFNLILNDDAAVASPTNSRKKKRTQLGGSKSRHSDGSIGLVKHADDIKANTDPKLFIVASTIQKNLIIFSWLENSTVHLFDSRRWLDDKRSVMITDKIELTKKKTEIVSAHHALNGHDVASTKHYNEGNATVSDGYDLTHTNDDDDDETLAERVAKLTTDAMIAPKKQKKALNNNNTLTTILAQSLRNNDHSLLESVLINKDQQVIQNTISRLDPTLAIILLDRISERIARQASRFDQLLYWLKWIIVIHGSILSSIPSLASKLSNLHGILSKKADTLPKLLTLKDKMAIIQQQYEVNRTKHDFDGDASDEETDVEYVEELDDAKANGEIESDRDDYEDSDMSIDESEDEEEFPTALDLEAEEDGEDGYSDEEIDVNNGIVESDQESEN